MGKIRTRILGLEEVEKKQKEEQKKRSEEKRLTKKTMFGEVKTTEKNETTKISDSKKTKKQIRSGSRGKKYQQARASFDKTKEYSLEEAVKILKKIKYAQFTESVELHINVVKTGLKGEVELPHQTGKKLRIAIVDEKLLDNLKKGIINFDILITHPSYMPQLAKYARLLGPKGLMPNPKAGTISTQPETVAKKFAQGTLRWKTESKYPLIHQLIAKLDADDKVIVENAQALLKSIDKKNIKNAYIKSTMSPSVKLSLDKLN